MYVIHITISRVLSGINENALEKIQHFFQKWIYYVKKQLNDFNYKVIVWVLGNDKTLSPT